MIESQLCIMFPQFEPAMISSVLLAAGGVEEEAIMTLSSISAPEFSDSTVLARETSSLQMMSVTNITNTQPVDGAVLCTF
eukprot:SAG31_NODE_548_length_14222_cov_10.926574_15_plen_80_part_00